MALAGRRILVTGAAGFAGRSLVPALREEGAEVVGTSRAASPEGWMRRIDLAEARPLRDLVAAVRPAAIVHLAGVTYLPDVEADPVRSFTANVVGTLNLLEAAAHGAREARILIASSCSVYGEPRPGDLPLREDAPLRAVHPYGVQKIGMEILAERFRRERGLDVIVVRPFNHIGPGQDPRISFTWFAGQIAEAERGRRPPVLRVGNLAARRDLLDVRDVVRAYRLLLAHPEPPRTVNVASGRSVGIGEALEIMLQRAGRPLSIESDPSRFRRIDVPDLVGDAGRLRQATGWAPSVPLAESLARILAAARGEDVGGPW